MKKKDLVVLLIIVIVGVVLISISSYAYFTATVTGTATANTVTTGTMAITYADGPEVSLDNAIPGDTVTKTFTVTNTGNVATTYDIYLSEVNNQFVDQTDLAYTLTSSDGGYSVTSDTQVPSASGKIVSSQTIATSATHTYTLTIKFLAKNENQDDNQGKKFSAKIQVNEYKDYDPTYADATGASKPELYQGLIPVKYDASGNTIVADNTKEWYDYATHEWANAVLVNCSDSTIKSKYFNDDMTLKSSVIGTTMSDSDILQYYVWIPRYKYLLWNAENGSSDPQAISITFEKSTDAKSTGSTNGTWLTHPAFTFGTTELNGIWVGKFENSGSTTNLIIKPNVTSLRNITVGDMFNASRNEELTYATNYGISSSQIDTHMMKNMEWGAVAYLSSSIYGRYNDLTTCISSGCEVWINPNSNYTTGCVGATVSASSTTACNAWNTSTGVNASTTGNMYGIYDMSGGAWEYVMGNMVDASGNFYPSSSGLSKPDVKYYNSYAYSASTYTDHARGGIGDATKETLKTFGSKTGGWYSDYSHLLSDVYSWFERGGYFSDEAYAGAFYFGRATGGADAGHSFRSVITSD